MHPNYIERLREENENLKDERERYLADRFKEKNRRAINAIKNGYVEKPIYLDRDDVRIIYDDIVMIEENMLNLETEISCMIFGNSEANIRKSKIEGVLLGVINKSEKILKLVEQM